MFTLYVSRDKRHPQRADVGSVLCLNLLQHLKNESRSTVTVQECDKNTPHKPDWLYGTPTLHNRHTSEVFRGHSAVSFLQNMALENASTHEKNEKVSQGGARKRSPMAPGIQLRPESIPNASTPDEEEETRDEVLEDGLWGSTIDINDEDDASVMDETKMSQDDLHRALEGRRSLSSESFPENAPPLPPLNATSGNQ